MRRRSKGFSSVEILIGGALLLTAIVATLQLQFGFFSSVRRDFLREEVNNLVEQRAAYVQQRVNAENGVPNLLRQFATTSGDLAVFDPVLDVDPAGVFAATFPALANPETIPLAKSTITVTYQVWIASQSINPGTGVVSSTPISYPNSTISLSEVNTFSVRLTARNADTGKLVTERTFEFSI